MLPKDFRFAEPLILLALLLLPALWAWRRFGPFRRPTTLAWADAAGWSGGATLRTRLARLVALLPWLALALTIVALARPQSGSRAVQVTSEGIDIMLAIDASGSMRAEDFKPNNRLYVARQVADQFVDGRVGDRIGLTVFAGAAYTQCPLTLDYGVLKQLIATIDFGTPDGTAVGMAIANSVNRLRKSTARSKVIILLTDGRNNAGEIDPVTAAEAARALRIKIYTIGVGVEGEADYPVDDPLFGRRYVKMASDVDDPTLKKIADLTGGLFFRATSAEALKEIYARIDRLEKTKVESREYVDYADLGPRYLAWAAGLLALTVSAGALGLRRRP